MHSIIPGPTTRREFIRALVVAGVLGSPLPAAPEEKFPLPTIRAKYCDEGIVEPIPIDSEVWEKAESVLFDHDWNGRPRRPEMATRVQTLWNERRFYVRFECKYLTLYLDPNPRFDQDAGGICWQDAVEFFIAPDPKRIFEYKEFQMSPQGEWFDALIYNDGITVRPEIFHWNTGFKVVSAQDPAQKRWWVSASVPVGKISGQVKTGDRWRINFYRIETLPSENKKRITPYRKFQAWSPTLTREPNFHEPQRFGWIEFVR